MTVKRSFALGLAWLLAACSPLTLFNAAMPKDPGGVRIAQDLAFGSDPRQRLDLYAPKVRPLHPLPMIIFFYGGSWNSGTKDGYAFVGRALAARGFLVAIPDYRLIPAIRYPAFLADNAAAVRWLRGTAARYGGDPDRLLLAGHSAGAYNAAMLALDPHWLGADRKAVRGLIGLAGPYDFLPFDGAVAVQTFAAAPDPEATQPVHYVTADSPPAFLATGNEDTIVRPANSDSLAARLTAAGVTVERRRYPGIGHAGLVTAIARPLRHRAPVLDDLIAFAMKATAPRAMEP
jgi:acetyl esterase/lipase